tara:strand:- start:467 stop:727 length:261 start_codon:yes stop_codon:yes gene_type:complete
MKALLRTYGIEHLKTGQDWRLYKGAVESGYSQWDEMKPHPDGGYLQLCEVTPLDKRVQPYELSFYVYRGKQSLTVRITRRELGGAQ